MLLRSVTLAAAWVLRPGLPGGCVEEVGHARQGGARAGWQVAEYGGGLCPAGERVCDFGGGWPGRGYPGDGECDGAVGV